MKRIIAVFLSLLICILSVCSSFTAYASTSIGDTDFSDLIFSTSSNVPLSFDNADYYFLAVRPVYDSTNLTFSFNYYLYFVDDKTYESEETTAFEPANHFGQLIFDVDSEISSTVLTGGYNFTATSVTYNTYYYVGYFSYSKTSNRWVREYALSSSISSSYWLFDNYNSDKWLGYYNGYGQYILASNCDIYSRTGKLLQYGNYYDFLAYFDYNLPYDTIDYSGYQSDPNTQTTTSDSGSSGSSGSSSSDEQVKISSNILDNVKNLLETVFNLPQKIADKLGGFFTSLGDRIGEFFTLLKDGLLDGLKALFVPTGDSFSDLVDLIHSKFGFIFQLLEISDFLINYDFSESPPEAVVLFSKKVDNGFLRNIPDIEIMDWSVIEPYRNLIKNLTLAISWYFFLRKVSKRLPDVINGVSSGGGL